MFYTKVQVFCAILFLCSPKEHFLTIHIEMKLFPTNLIVLKAFDHGTFLPIKMKILEDHITYM